jgi:hypothetical protein
LKRRDKGKEINFAMERHADEICYDTVGRHTRQQRYKTGRGTSTRVTNTISYSTALHKRHTNDRWTDSITRKETDFLHKHTYILIAQ